MENRDMGQTRSDMWPASYRWDLIFGLFYHRDEVSGQAIHIPSICLGAAGNSSRLAGTEATLEAPPQLRDLCAAQRFH